MEAKLIELQEGIETGEAEIRSLEQQIAALIRSREEDSVKGEVEARELELKEKEKAKAKAVSHLKTPQDNIKQEERKRTQIQKSLEVFIFLYITLSHVFLHSSYIPLTHVLTIGSSV